MFEPSHVHFAAGAGSGPRHLRPPDTVERMQAIAEYAILDTPAEAAFDAMAGLAAEICATSMAAISLVCEDRQWFKAMHGLTMRETPIEQSICAYTLDGNGPLVVSDAATHPIFCDNELVLGSFNLRFYAGVPLHSHSGVPIGALCVLDRSARSEGLSAAQARALAVLGKQVEAQLELRRTVMIQERRTERERRLSRELEHVASHDSLTGLPNRSHFMREFDKALRSSRSGARPALLLIDFNNFRAINADSGHAAGDLILVEMARRLKDAMGPDMVAARIGGDEFAVMIPHCDSHSAAFRAAGAIEDAVKLPFLCDGKSIDCGISFGYALASSHVGDCAALFRKADLALASAKEAGSGCPRAFSATLGRVRDHERSMIEKARSALSEGRILPYYQPKVDLNTGQLAGFEALLRIQTSNGGIELPAAIAAAFEHRELAVPITDCMIGAVLAELSQARSAGIEIGHVAINASSFDFTTTNFAARLLAKLATHGFPTSMIEVEITESVVMGKGADHIRHSLKELDDAGVGISLDDFGTGYASLTNIKQLPISALKIDRSFVSGLGTATDDSIILAMSTLGARMGLKIVAEGVETERHVEMLRRFGIPYGQGMLFSPAVPGIALDEITKIASSGRWKPAKPAPASVRRIA